jgi:TatD DNase family protein
MYIDAHVHLDKYSDRLDDAVKQIIDMEIFTVATAMDPPSYAELKKIARRSDLILPTFGVHPKRAPQYAQRLRELSPLIEESPAIGEIGLDFHWVKEPASYPSQRKVLEYFFAAAREQKKIVNLHTKGAEKEILQLLERYEIQRPIIHWYSGPVDILQELITYGAYFTIGVEVHSSRQIQEIAAIIPETLLLTETDNPGGLEWLEGKPGMPEQLAKVVEALAQLRNLTAAEMARAIRRNFARLIGGDPWLREAQSVLQRAR